MCAHGDLFHEAVPDHWIDQVFAIMALAGRHQFQVLTKRSSRMRVYLADRSRSTIPRQRAARFLGYSLMWGRDGTTNDPRSAELTVAFPLRNVWIGVSVEDYLRFARIVHLRETPAAVRFVSFEPMHSRMDGVDLEGVDWAIAGGESGRQARPMNPEWVRDLRDRCAAAGVPFFFKQWGEWVSVSEVEGKGEHYTFPDHRTIRPVGKARASRTLDGVVHDAMPA